MVLEVEWPAQLLVLPAAAGSGTKSLAKVAKSVAGTFDRVGRAFHQIVNPPQEEDAWEEEDQGPNETEEEKKMREGMQSFDNDLEDYYALLGLDHMKFEASVNDIKAQWKLAAMWCHPDKASPTMRSRAEDRYKALQRGVDILTDPQKRKAYDSSLPFDDSIPNKDAGNTPETFFKVYGPVFQANSRFSIDKGCPALGDANTPDEEVENFYGFWSTFKSWREFKHPDEESVNDGTWREEKRRIERKNAKLRQAAKKMETQRVQKLVEDAMKKDPRWQRIINKEKNAKMAKKKAKEEAKKKAEEEAAAAEAAKAAAEAAAEAAAKESAVAKKMQTNILKNLRKQVRKLGKQVIAVAEAFTVDRTKPLDEDDVETLATECSLEDLTELKDLLVAEKSSDDRSKSYLLMINKLNKIQGKE